MANWLQINNTHINLDNAVSIEMQTDQINVLMVNNDAYKLKRLDNDRLFETVKRYLSYKAVHKQL